MGADYTSHVVVGIKIADLYPKTFEKSSEVVKYDVNTGAPHSVTVKSWHTQIGELVFDGKLLDFIKLFTEMVEDTPFVSASTPTAISSSYLTDLREDELKDVILGCTISSVSDWNGCKPDKIDLKMIDSVRNELNEWLRMHLRYNKSAEVYNVLVASY